MDQPPLAPASASSVQVSTATQTWLSGRWSLVAWREWNDRGSDQHKPIQVNAKTGCRKEGRSANRGRRNGCAQPLGVQEGTTQWSDGRGSSISPVPGFVSYWC
jgi:hypothetical protein